MKKKSQTHTQFLGVFLLVCCGFHLAAFLRVVCYQWLRVCLLWIVSILQAVINESAHLHNKPATTKLSASFMNSFSLVPHSHSHAKCARLRSFAHKYTLTYAHVARTIAVDNFVCQCITPASDHLASAQQYNSHRRCIGGTDGLYS